MLNPRVLVASLLLCGNVVPAQSLPIVSDVDRQPLAAQVRRLIEAHDYLGNPFTPVERAALDAALADPDSTRGVASIQTVLDARCLFGVTINPEMRVSVQRGAARPELVQDGWRQFLIKVANQAGATGALQVMSPNAPPLALAQERHDHSDHAHRAAPATSAPAEDAWLQVRTYDKQPMTRTLTGLALEYRMVHLFSRDAGQREARFMFNVGQGTQDLGFRSETDVLFACQPARTVKLRVRDEHGNPASGSFLIRDPLGRVYPSQAGRLEPDFVFHPQVYRADGETLSLPDGEFEIEFRRGPESYAEVRRVTVDESLRELAFAVRRWIDPAAMGWWSGDHHIHAAGCAHYVSTNQGVLAEHMARHIMGEDLKVGANLTWGPGFDYQKQFFTGKDDKASQYPYLLRYDIEVSGFGSHRSGHLCLLRLREQMYPGGDSTQHWPTLGLNTLRWAKAQGALAGPAHSGWGLQPLAEDDVASRTALDRGSQGRLESVTQELPNYIVPAFNGIGANEYIMNVTHEVPGPDGARVPAVDFMSTVDTPSTWELNMWYHTLNAGFRTRISGETDFPCIYGERVGLGRSYVHLDGPLNYEAWCEGIRRGRNYVSDGKSHLINFHVNNVAMGEQGSELRLDGAGTVRLRAQVAALLDAVPDERIRRTTWDQKPYWDLERARIGDGRSVPVEVIVNGHPVAKREIPADGSLQEVAFEIALERSSWVALRILPSSHTNPVWVLVGDKPVRASRRSVEWCLKGVDVCWSQKERFYAPGEMEQARADYEHARRAYRARLAECEVD